MNPMWCGAQVCGYLSCGSTLGDLRIAQGQDGRGGKPEDLHCRERLVLPHFWKGWTRDCRDTPNPAAFSSLSGAALHPGWRRFLLCFSPFLSCWLAQALKADAQGKIGT